MVDTANVFFYGLFMDMDLLREQGLQPDDPRQARLDGYGLRIGERATLVASQREQVFGIVAATGSARATQTLWRSSQKPTDEAYSSVHSWKPNHFNHSTRFPDFGRS
ncbi:MAG: hypothetical protein ACR2RB_20615 [Gammaproteobacteria bacterium]